MATTTERGLGWHDHAKPRQQALRELRDGDACARCENRGRYHPMWRSMVTRRPDGRLVAPLLELDDFPPRVIARQLGITPRKRLSWKRCNRSHGGRLGNRIKALRRAQTKPAQAPKYDRW